MTVDESCGGWSQEQEDARHDQQDTPAPDSTTMFQGTFPSGTAFMGGTPAPRNLTREGYDSVDDCLQDTPAPTPSRIPFGTDNSFAEKEASCSQSVESAIPMNPADPTPDAPMTQHEIEEFITARPKNGNSHQRKAWRVAKNLLDARSRIDILTAQVDAGDIIQESYEATIAQKDAYIADADWLNAQKDAEIDASYQRGFDDGASGVDDEVPKLKAEIAELREKLDHERCEGEIDRDIAFRERARAELAERVVEAAKKYAAYDEKLFLTTNNPREADWFSSSMKEAHTELVNALAAAHAATEKEKEI
jgi:hypothetical protein